MTESLLPYSEKAEEAVVGSILLDDGFLPDVMAIVRAEDFYCVQYRVIFEAQVRLQKGIDLLTLCEELRLAGNLHVSGGEPAVHGLMEKVPWSEHAVHYARMVADLAVRRRLMAAGMAIVQRALNTEQGEQVGDLLAWANSELMEVCLDGAMGGPISIEEAANDLSKAVQHWAANPLAWGQVRGLSSGLHSLDALLNGMQGGELILLAGRPGMGKSALAFEVARNVASVGGRVLILSLEMNHRQVVGRWASALSGVATHRVERGVRPERYVGTAVESMYVSDQDLAGYAAALAEIALYANVVIDDRAALSTA